MAIPKWMGMCKQLAGLLSVKPSFNQYEWFTWEKKTTKKKEWERGKKAHKQTITGKLWFIHIVFSQLTNAWVELPILVSHLMDEPVFVFIRHTFPIV